VKGICKEGTEVGEKLLNCVGETCLEGVFPCKKKKGWGGLWLIDSALRSQKVKKKVEDQKLRNRAKKGIPLAGEKEKEKSIKEK